MTFNLVRWTKVTDNIVEWGNIVGPYSGQSGIYEFSTDEDARLERST